MLAALQTLSSFVLGHVFGELADGEAARRTGLTHEQWMERRGEYGDAVVADERHPRLSRILVEAAAPHAADRQERAFEASLARVLDGIGAHLPGVTAPGT